MVDKWLKALDRRELVGVILVDFRKDFDLVDHGILLRKLEIYKLNQIVEICLDLICQKVHKRCLLRTLSQLKSLLNMECL